MIPLNPNSVFTGGSGLNSTVSPTQYAKCFSQKFARLSLVETSFFASKKRTKRGFATNPNRKLLLETRVYSRAVQLCVFLSCLWTFKAQIKPNFLRFILLACIRLYRKERPPVKCCVFAPLGVVCVQSDMISYGTKKIPKQNVLQTGVTRSISPKYCQNAVKNCSLVP